MKLTDLLPIEKWVELEKRIHKKYGLNAAVFDKKGVRITQYMNWANKLCPVIKKNQRGQTYICSLAHKNLTIEIEKTGLPSVGECDAGFFKFAVPINWRGELLGVAGGCGRVVNGNSVESFLINMTTGIEETEVARLSKNVRSMDSLEVEKAVDFVTKELKRLVNENPLTEQGALNRPDSEFSLSVQ
jgi:ligand-binding sensor protein